MGLPPLTTPAALASLAALLLCGLIAPAAAHACTPLRYARILSWHWPADAQTDVPPGLVLIGLEELGYPGTSYFTVRVTDNGVEVPGQEGSDVWRPLSPMARDRVYEVTVDFDYPQSVLAAGFPTTTTFSFRTTSVQTPPRWGQLSAVTTELVPHEQDLCMHWDYSTSCRTCLASIRWPTKRLVVTASHAGPLGPLDQPYRVRTGFGRNPQAAQQAIASNNPLIRHVVVEPGAFATTIDLGCARQWESDQVCLRAEVVTFSASLVLRGGTQSWLGNNGARWSLTPATAAKVGERP